MESGNLLILQSGMSGVVGNSILYGLLNEALQHEAIEEIYGAYDGFEGIASSHWIPLADLPQKTVQNLLSTAGYALRHESDGFVPNDEVFHQMVENLSNNNIKWVAVIGNQSSIIWSRQLVQAAEAAHYPLQVLVAPQSNHNDLPITDYSLSYGSVLKFLNASLISFNKMLAEERITVGIFEIDGCKNGWIPAGTILSQIKCSKTSNMNELPYVVCLPEQPFESATFLDKIRAKRRPNTPLTIVTSSQLIDADGQPLDIQHYGSVKTYLEYLIQDNLKLVTYGTQCNLYTQPLSHFISKQDQDNAVNCGAETIKALMDGVSGKAAILVKGNRKDTLYNIDFVPLKDMENGTKFFPVDWITADGLSVNYSMVKYAAPLIKGEVAEAFENGIPHLAQL